MNNNPLNMRSLSKNNSIETIATAFDLLPEFKNVLIDDISEFVYFKLKIDSEPSIVAQTYDLYLDNKTSLRLMIFKKRGRNDRLEITGE